MKMLYNTLSEIAVRQLILLSECSVPKEAEHLTIYDLFATYGERYGFLKSNLHGDSIININEFSTRYILVSKAIKFLVINGLINYENTQYGFAYTINNYGLDLCKNLSSPYALEYKKSVKCVLERTQNMDIKELKKIVFDI